MVRLRCLITIEQCILQVKDDIQSEFAGERCQRYVHNFAIIDATHSHNVIDAIDWVVRRKQAEGIFITLDVYTQV